jgi:hypothetical protein
VAINPHFTHCRAAHIQPRFARWTGRRRALPNWAVVTVLQDAEVRGSKGTPQALKRGYVNRLTARVELVPFPVVNAAEEG